MADTFGIGQSGRIYGGGRFYAIPAVDVAANAIFMPAFSSSPFFGVAEYPVNSGKPGSFATEGTFAFAKPDGFVSSPGQAVYYKPTSAAEGTISSAKLEGSVLIGYETPANAPGDKLCVFLSPGDALAGNSEA